MPSQIWQSPRVHDCQPTPTTQIWREKACTIYGLLFSFFIFSCLQGFRSFAWMAIFYQMKDELKPSPSVSQFLVSAAFIPWSVKPMIYG
jgi:hypothetical protein